MNLTVSFSRSRPQAQTVPVRRHPSTQSNQLLCARRMCPAQCATSRRSACARSQNTLRKRSVRERFGDPEPSCVRNLSIVSAKSVENVRPNFDSFSWEQPVSSIARPVPCPQRISLSGPAHFARFMQAKVSRLDWTHRHPEGRHARNTDIGPGERVQSLALRSPRCRFLTVSPAEVSSIFQFLCCAVSWRSSNMLGSPGEYSRQFRRNMLTVRA